MYENIQLESWSKMKHHEIKIKVKPERTSIRIYQIPKDIKKPNLDKEGIYSDNNYLYRIAPYSLPKEEQFFCLVAAISFLYYGLTKYDKETGRRLEVIYSHTDRKAVEEYLKNNYSELKKLDNPYLLYDLRISHGYFY